MRLLTPEEQREKLIDDRFVEFGRRIASFDPLIEEIRKAKENVQGFVTSLQSQSDKEASEHNELRASIRSLESNDNLSEVRFKNLSERLDKLSDQHRNSRSSLNAVESLSLLHLEKIKTLTEKIPNLDRLENDLKIFRAEISKELKSIADDSKIKEEEIDGVHECVVSIKDQLDSLQKSKGVQDKVIKDLRAALEDEAIKRQDKEQTLVNYIESRCAELKAQFDYKLSNLPLPKVDGYATKESVEKIASQIEVLYLDAKNALLKASNVEIQSQVQAKKVENIFLTLKNQELKG